MISSPIGEQAEAYRIVWDRELVDIAQAFAKYESLQGFKGIVATAKGLGARFDSSSFQQARAAAGMAEGEIFQISGLPLDVSESEVLHFTDDLHWKVEVIKGSRMVRGRTASVRVRAARAPKQDVVKVVSGQEIITLHITTPTRRTASQVKEDDKLPNTWQQAFKSTSGKVSRPFSTATGRAG